jgi:orotidine-5'-phosphate decarboxylase
VSVDLVVALDFPERAPAEALIEKLSGLPVVYKVGLELFIASDPAWVKSLTAAGKRVFLDLKLHDIPNTVAMASIQAAKLGVEFLTVHLSGGSRMLDEIDFRMKDALDSGLIRRRPKILGVSVLTSFQEEEWSANVSHVSKLSGIRTIEESVVRYSDLASLNPCVDGMVCSPKEVAAVRAKYPELFLMIPGIRMAGGNLNDQKRVMTPSEAKAAGASAIVVGRPITESRDPRGAALEILKEIV